jgi:hypothetical protein
MDELDFGHGTPNGTVAKPERRTSEKKSRGRHNRALRPLQTEVFGQEVRQL